MAQIPPFYLDAVVAIGNRDTQGIVQWVASGFLFGGFLRKVDEETSQYRVWLVTNKHVVQGLDAPVIRANPVGDAPAKEYGLESGPAWVGHPDDAVDVAVTPVLYDALTADGVKLSFFHSDMHARTLAGCLEEGISEGDDLFLLGFPMGLVGGPRSAVILRQGIIARMKDCHEGVSRSFLVDGYVFPGNSGGPVVTRAATSGIVNTKVPSASYLIGIVASYVTYDEVAVSGQTGRPRVVFQENSGLSNVFPVDCIQEAIAAYNVQNPLPADVAATGDALSTEPPAGDEMTGPEVTPVA